MARGENAGRRRQIIPRYLTHLAAGARQVRKFRISFTIKRRISDREKALIFYGSSGPGPVGQVDQNRRAGRSHDPVILDQIAAGLIGHECAERHVMQGLVGNETQNQVRVQLLSNRFDNQLVKSLQARC